MHCACLVALRSHAPLSAVHAPIRRTVAHTPTRTSSSTSSTSGLCTESCRRVAPGPRRTVAEVSTVLTSPAGPDQLHQLGICVGPHYSRVSHLAPPPKKPSARACAPLLGRHSPAAQNSVTPVACIALCVCSPGAQSKSQRFPCRLLQGRASGKDRSTLPLRTLPLRIQLLCIIQLLRVRRTRAAGSQLS